MLIYVFASVLLLAPALQAVFDLPLQLAFQQAVLLAFLAWCWLAAAEQRREVFGKKFLWLWAAAALSLLALVFSPFKGCIVNEWGNYGAGLLVFVFSSFLTAEERAVTDRAVTAGAWLVFALVLVQIFFLKNLLARPPLTNLNALALYGVMVFPLALTRGAWLLAAAMASFLILSQSLGAVLAGLGAALFYAATRPGGRAGAGGKWFYAAMLAGALVVFYFLQADSLAGRLAWWRSAWGMFLARPLTGFGHAAFTWAQVGFQAPGAFREHAIYAHNYYLEYLAENGLPAAAVWFWFLFSAARSRKGLLKFSVIGALLHSFVDFGLSVPANFWLFCYLAATPAEETAPAHQRPGSGRLLPARAVFGLALVLEAALLTLNFKSLAFERARERALAAAAGGSAAAEAQLNPYLARGLFRGPALEFLGRLAVSGSANKDNGLSSAVYFEMALLENPYSARAWRALERLYGVPGRENEAASLAARRAAVYK